MEALAEELKSGLTVKTVFTIPIFGGIPIKESVVVTWIVTAVLIILGIWLAHGLSVKNPSKRQIFAEMVVSKLDSLVGGMLGPNAAEYTTYLETVLLYIGLANIMGIFGFDPPTKDLNTTAALALMSIILIEASGIRARKVKGWLHSFAEPVAVVTPINILEIGIRPLSLCMRLFGNVLGSFVIMTLIEYVVPVVLPIILSLYFDIFDGFIQAYVFVFLTSLFISEACEIPAPTEKKAKKSRGKKDPAAEKKAVVA
ncbi:MAG: F0F1 ATP synthase subunit A [Eubacteriales bacterium]|jgi:F-type H+-transporting ATPase subunit a